MAKNRITEQLANNEVTLDLAFNNLLLIASVINNKELLGWVEREISGYQDSDNLPVYRKNEKSLHFIFSGLNGTYPINNMPMPITYFPEEIRTIVPNVKILEGVKIIERQLAVKDSEWSVTRDCTEYANDVYLNTGIQCFNISQVLQKSHYEKVYNNIKVHLMKILLMIEKWFGSLEPSELESKKYERQKVIEAGKLISTYIAGLLDNKTGIPNPRISMPSKALDQKQSPGKAQQLIMPQMPPQGYQIPQQQPMPQMPPQGYQMPQQQPLMPQMPPQGYQMPQQQPMLQMAQAYQMPQQQPMPPQQQPLMPQMPSSQQAQTSEEPVLPVLYEEFSNGKPLNEHLHEKQEHIEQEVQVKPQVKGHEEKTADISVAEKYEKHEKDDAAKAAEIRKDRIPKSLLDYLEEKKSELSKKNE